MGGGRAVGGLPMRIPLPQCGGGGRLLHAPRHVHDSRVGDREPHISARSTARDAHPTRRARARQPSTRVKGPLFVGSTARSRWGPQPEARLANPEILASERATGVASRRHRAPPSQTGPSHRSSRFLRQLLAPPISIVGRRLRGSGCRGRFRQLTCSREEPRRRGAGKSGRGKMSENDRASCAAGEQGEAMTVAAWITPTSPGSRQLTPRPLTENGPGRASGRFDISACSASHRSARTRDPTDEAAWARMAARCTPRNPRHVPRASSSQRSSGPALNQTPRTWAQPRGRWR